MNVNYEHFFDELFGQELEEQILQENEEEKRDRGDKEDQEEKEDREGYLDC